MLTKIMNMNVKFYNAICMYVYISFLNDLRKQNISRNINVTQRIQ